MNTRFIKIVNHYFNVHICIDIDKLNSDMCDPLWQNPEQGSFVKFSTFNIKWTTLNYKLRNDTKIMFVA